MQPPGFVVERGNGMEKSGIAGKADLSEKNRSD